MALGPPTWPESGSNLSVVVPAVEVSVSPYPSTMGHEKQTLIKSRTFLSRGADPVAIVWTLPPSRAATLPKTRES